MCSFYNLIDAKYQKDGAYPQQLLFNDKDERLIGFKFPIFTVVFFFLPILFPLLSRTLIFTYWSSQENIQSF